MRTRVCSGRGLRRDSAELVAFAESTPRLPPRVREVFERCVRDTFTIDECAADLGIGRATVRRHLERLRALARGARS